MANWFYAGLIGHNNPRWLKADLVVCASSFSWMYVGECFFTYQLTRVVPDKGPLNDCVYLFTLNVFILCLSILLIPAVHLSQLCKTLLHPPVDS